ncbi:MAG TPA: ABC transporter permease [Acidimicrobiia bacterium]|jgi:peptide/nickel transport system permease protein|nr:ABC transporter permease [Acidimicrobiia bacterium]
MLRFLTGRALWALVTLFLFISLVFFLVNVLVPYDYATQFWLVGGNPLVEAVREQIGLDRSLWVRYLDQMTGLLQLDLGRSFSGQSVTSAVGTALPVTLLAFSLGGVVAFLFGDWIGRMVAWRRKRLLSASMTTVSVGLYTAFPPLLVFVLMYLAIRPLGDIRESFGLPADGSALWTGSVTEGQATLVVAIAIVIALAVALLVRGWTRRREMSVLSWLSLPLAFGGAAAAIASLGISSQALEILFRVTGVGAEQASSLLGVGSGRSGNMLVAALALILIAFGEVAMVVKAGMDDEMGEDYVLTAHAKGVHDRSVRDRHVARNVVLPVLSRAVIGVPYLLTGLIIIERELQLPGLSSLFFEAVATVDVPLIIGVLIVIGLLVLLLRLLLDILHVALDPRIRMAGAASQ